MPNCKIFQKFSRLCTILSFLKYKILTSHIYILKLCQDRLYSVVCIKNFSAEHILNCGIQSANVIFRQKYYFLLKMLAICTPMNQIALSSDLFESAYALSMSTTKIIHIISSSTKLLFLKDILLKCCQKIKQ